MKLTERLGKEWIFFDGGMGTILQEHGLKAGELPETWNLSHPDEIIALNRSYFEAGCDVVNTNTFGANALKYPDNLQEIVQAAVSHAKTARQQAGREDAYIALDIGPTGKLLQPMGDLPFERAVELFGETIRIGAAAGADLVLIETMSDSYEAKAAVLAAKENCDLPVLVTLIFDEKGKLLTGGTVDSTVAMLEGLRVDALGVNCSLGPDKMLPVVEQLCKYSSVPVIVNPNAGLPSTKNGKTEFNINAETFSDCMRKIAVSGAAVLGGCCGTTPEFIKKTVEKTADIPLNITEKNYTLVSSYTHAHEVGGKKPTLIGERINPTGKPKFKEALRRNDIPYIVNEGLSQAEKGVHILDVNVGLPKIDEKEMMIRAVLQLQAVCELPLQIDSTAPAVLEGAMRIYNGKPLVNSVNGDEENMESVFPLVKKYGGTVIALTLDKGGIPETAAERFAIAEKIIARAAEYGIAKKDIVADPLALTVSSNQESANITLDTVKMLKNAGIRTSLGVSNISFGLPHRETVNSVFFTAALCAGLDCAIMNPFAEGMLNAYYAFNALTGRDAACAEYISYAAGITDTAVTAGEALGLKAAVIKGLREQAVKAAHELAENTPPLEIINNYIIPALDTVGNDFENKKAYLPQLLMSAEAASAAFEVIKEKLPPKSESSDRKVILATVKGDIHDIGKNIVKVMLESYGFTVCDLGRDVPPEAVVKAALEENCRLVGLSALMTTTVPSMEETIKQLKKADPKIKTIVGGAVLTQEYADMIGADYYGRDAMESVRCAEKFYSE